MVGLLSESAVPASLKKVCFCLIIRDNSSHWFKRFLGNWVLKSCLEPLHCPTEASSFFFIIIFSRVQEGLEFNVTMISLNFYINIFFKILVIDKSFRETILESKLHLEVFLCQLKHKD